MITYPERQQGVVRSIQVNDEDVREAGPGIHVGLALKGILPKYLERGTTIAAIGTDDVVDSNELKFKFKPAAFGDKPEVGDRIHVVSGLYDSPAEILEYGNTLSIKTDKPLPFHECIRVTAVDLNKKPAILGSKMT